MRMKTIGVIGAGQMGAGIAQIAAARGLQVLLADVSEEAAHAGKARIGASLEKAVSREKLHAADKEDRKSVVKGKSVSVSVDLGGRRIHKKKTKQPQIAKGTKM